MLSTAALMGIQQATVLPGQFFGQNRVQLQRPELLTSFDEASELMGTDELDRIEASIKR